MPQTTISNIVLLVHPFYTLHFARQQYGIDALQAKKNMSFLAGIWGNELKKAALNKQSLVVIVSPFLLPRPRFLPSFNRFLNFARKTFGDRLIELHDSIKVDVIAHHLDKHDMKLDRKILKGKSFGEYLGQCVTRQTKILEKGLGVKIIVIPKLSIENYSGGGKPIGSYFEDIRKEAGKRRRNDRKTRKNLKRPR